MPVASGNLEGAKEAEFPSGLQPMLLHSAKQIVERPGWIYEPKFDGMRAIIYIQGGSCRILSRNGRDITQTFPELIEPLSLQQDCVLDAELAILDSAGVVDFEALQSRWLLTKPKDIQAKVHETPAALFVFDILYAMGEDLTSCRLSDRKEVLNQLLRRSQQVQHVPVFDDGHALFSAGKLHKLEGVISKRADSTYKSGFRSKNWVKTKYFETGSFFIVGHKANEGFLVSTDESFENIVGFVQYGFLSVHFDVLKSVLKNTGFLKNGTQLFEPTVRINVEFMQWTKTGKLRFPVFKGFCL